MSLPSTVPGSWPDNNQARCGPFSTDGTDRWVFTVDQSTNKIRCYKSTDYGQTWTEQDSANAPTTGTSAGYRVADVQQDASTLTTFHVMRGADAGGNFLVTKFVAGAWSTTTSSTNAPPSLAHGTGALGVTTNYSTSFISLAVRPNGDYVALYQGKTESSFGINVGRFWWRVYSGGTWGTETGFGTSFVPFMLISSIVGASGRVHMLYRTGSSSNLRHRSLDTSGTLDTEHSVSSLGIDNNDTLNGPPTAWVNGANIECVLIYVDTSSSQKVLRWNSAANPTFSTDALVSGGSDIPKNGWGQIAVMDTGRKLAAFTTNARGVMCVMEDQISNSWQSIATVETGTSSKAIQSAFFIDGGGIGQNHWSAFINNGCQAVLWNNTSNVVQYDQLIFTRASSGTGWIYVGDPIQL